MNRVHQYVSREERTRSFFYFLQFFFFVSKAGLILIVFFFFHFHETEKFYSVRLQNIIKPGYINIPIPHRKCTISWNMFIFFLHTNLDGNSRLSKYLFSIRSERFRLFQTAINTFFSQTTIYRADDLLLAYPVCRSIPYVELISVHNKLLGCWLNVILLNVNLVQASEVFCLMYWFVKSTVLDNMCARQRRTHKCCGAVTRVMWKWLVLSITKLMKWLRETTCQCVLSKNSECFICSEMSDARPGCF